MFLDSKMVKLRQEFDMNALNKSIDKKAEKKEVSSDFSKIDE
jgi:hypothetical protein